MSKNWKKCPDPEHSRIHPKWFNLDYYFSEHGIYCLSNDCADCKNCSLNESEDCIAQYVKDAKVYYSADNGKTKKTVDINMIPSKIEFMTLLVEEKIGLFGQRTNS